MGVRWMGAEMTDPPEIKIDVGPSRPPQDIAADLQKWRDDIDKGARQKAALDSVVYLAEAFVNLAGGDIDLFIRQLLWSARLAKVAADETAGFRTVTALQFQARMETWTPEPEEE